MPFEKTTEKLRQWRSQKFNPIGKFFLKLKISANLMTFFALILGLLAVYFLFQNHLLFIIFAVLHVLADAADGLIARLTKPTKFGKYLDFFTDRLIEYLLILKLYLFLNDYYVILILALLIISHLVHLFSHFQYPAYFMRTGAIIVLTFYPLFPHLYLTLGYLLVGILALHALLLQLKKFILTRVQ